MLCCGTVCEGGARAGTVQLACSSLAHFRKNPPVRLGVSPTMAIPCCSPQSALSLSFPFHLPASPTYQGLFQGQVCVAKSNRHASVFIFTSQQHFTWLMSDFLKTVSSFLIIICLSVVVGTLPETGPETRIPVQRRWCRGPWQRSKGGKAAA